MDPRVLRRMQLIYGELQACEMALNNIEGRVAQARGELHTLIMGPVLDGLKGTITWTQFKEKARALRAGLQVVTQDAEIVANRWQDYLMISDQEVVDRGNRRKYNVPLENLDPGVRPLSPPPLRFPGQ